MNTHHKSIDHFLHWFLLQTSAASTPPFNLDPYPHHLQNVDLRRATV